MKIASLLLVPLLGGCIIWENKPEHLSDSRDNIPSATLDWLVPGRTTMADAFLRLGEPDEVTPDGHTVAWVTIDRLSGVSWLMYLPPTAFIGDEVDKQRFRRLGLQFNQDWILTNQWMRTVECRIVVRLVDNYSTNSRVQFGGDGVGDCPPPLDSVVISQP